MPITLVKPKPGRSPYYRLRGRYLRIRVDESTGTCDLKLAKKIKQKREDEIERGRLSKKEEPNFARAVTAYVQAGGPKQFMEPLLKYFGERPLREIGQAEIDACAADLYPNASPATRNRQVYTPISAALKHVGIETKFKRPKGGDGNKINDWLRHEQAFAVLEAAREVDPEFYILLYVFLYTGLRLSELLDRQCDDLNLSEARLFVPKTKNGKPRPVHLPSHVVAVLANHPRGADRPSEFLFRYHKGSRLYGLLDTVAAKAGVTFPERSKFHLMRHSFGAWMRRYGGLDTAGLVATGLWDSREAASRYEHVDASEEARKSDLLPIPKRINSDVR